MEKRVPITFFAALGVMAAALALILSRAPLSLAGSNGVPEDSLLSIFHSNTTVCQPEEAVPRDTAAIRLSILMLIGGRLEVDVRSRSHILTRGTLASGWRGRVVTVAVARLNRVVAHASVCLRLGPTSEAAGLIGARTPAGRAATVDGRSSPGRIRIEYLRGRGSSWWSLAPAIVRRMGLGRAWSGSGIALLVVVLMGMVTLLAAALVMRRLT